MTTLESAYSASPERSESAARAGLSKNVSLAEIKDLSSQHGSKDIPPVFNAATIDRDGNLHFGERFEDVRQTYAPQPMPDSDLDSFESLIKHNPHVVTKDLPDGGKRYSDDQGNAVVEYPDGRKIYAADGGRWQYEKRPDGSWKQSDYNHSPVRIVEMKADGSGQETLSTADRTITTTWGAGGVFQQKIDMNNHTGMGTITKPGPNGELVTSPITKA